jgi:hypothetical protein
MSRRNTDHLTLRYIYKRTLQIIWEWRNPNKPWLCKDATSFIDNWLSENDTLLEWGSGRSTYYLANRVRSMTSVEHDGDWYKAVSAGLTERHIQNVTLLQLNATDDASATTGISNICNTFRDFELDLVLVDGICRAECALNILTKIRPGGLLIIDDAHRYLSSDSTAPKACRKETGLWIEFTRKTKTWRKLWFSDGVHDCAIFVKNTTH